MSHTKVIATIGPSCNSMDVLRHMFMAGINVCRLNFSHGTHELHEKTIQTIIELNQELKTNVTIMVDLQGPRIRLGELPEEGVELELGDIVNLVTIPVAEGNAKQLPVDYKLLPQEIKVNETILIDDGRLKLRVTQTNMKDTVSARVIHGGTVYSHKGINLPETNLSMPSLTEKDMEDAAFALDHNVDWIALSFVRQASDLLPLRDLIRSKKKFARILAKIEKPEALENLDEIIEASNGLLVARGDLGVEVPFDRIPMIQKDIVSRCIAQAKPVVIATQMLESMVDNFRPTRAEAADVANAVLDGADAVMLSSETALGKYPLDAAITMKRIIDWTERHGFNYNKWHLPSDDSHTFLPDSICLSACRLAEQTDAKAIIVFTFSGYTALRIAAHRPKAETFVFTRNKALVRKMALIWGAHAYHAEESDSIDMAIEEATENLKNRGYLKEGDVVVYVGSTPFSDKGQTNMLKVATVE